MNIYVGNLSYDATEDDIRQAFTAFGQVGDVKIIMAAIDGMNGKEIAGREIKVNEARPREERGGGGGGGGRW